MDASRNNDEHGHKPWFGLVSSSLAGGFSFAFFLAFLALALVDSPATQGLRWFLVVCAVLFFLGTVAILLREVENWRGDTSSERTERALRDTATSTQATIVRQVGLVQAELKGLPQEVASAVTVANATLLESSQGKMNDGAVAANVEVMIKTLSSLGVLKWQPSDDDLRTIAKYVHELDHGELERQVRQLVAESRGATPLADATQPRPEPHDTGESQQSPTETRSPRRERPIVRLDR